MVRIKAILLILFFNYGCWGQSTSISLDELKALYTKYYVSSEVDSIDWKSKGTCDPGTLPEDLYKKVENRINYFRLVNRLPPLTIVPDKQKESQAGAFLIYKNNALSHYPPKTWKCYTEAAYDGANKSCLGFTNFKYYKKTAFITGFILDQGDENYFVGHRKWLLYSKATAYCYGATKTTEAIYCYKYDSDSCKADYIAYPWNGCVPYDQIYSKWSFSIPENISSDLSKAKVTVTDEQGNGYTLKMFPYYPNYLDNTVTWKMTSLFTEEEDKYAKNNLVEKKIVGKKLYVKIDNIKVKGKSKTYKYIVEVVKL